MRSVLSSYNSGSFIVSGARVDLLVSCYAVRSLQFRKLVRYFSESLVIIVVFARSRCVPLLSRDGVSSFQLREALWGRFRVD